MKRVIFSSILIMILLVSSISVASAAPGSNMIGINVVLKSDVTKQILTDLGKYGKVRDVVVEIKAVTMQVAENQLPAVQALPYVAAAAPDAERNGAPIDTVLATDFMNGMSTWDQDAINVTDFGVGRVVDYDGSGVYVAVVDTGLLDSWRQYFPQERIAEEYGIAFAGGGGDVGTVSSQPNKWQHDQSSHGTHVTSTILGYQYGTKIYNGVAPMATVIPVKVLNQNGSGWSSVIARGIVYVTDLKLNELENAPVVINMSLGGSGLDPMEKAAIDYAVANGVIVVASAGNNGLKGMGYPGAYEPVISVASVGWVKQWTPMTGDLRWWNSIDVPDPTDAADYFIADSSSREKPGQDLDVAAPGVAVVGPYQVNSGQLSYYYLSGTSMASPHVAGIAALVMQKDPTIKQTGMEALLEGAALPLPAGDRTVKNSSGVSVIMSWGTDATGAGLITADAALEAVP